MVEEKTADKADVPEGFIAPEEFTKRYPIDWSNQLPGLSTAGADAFGINARSGADHMVLVQQPTVPVRSDVLQSLCAEPVAHMLNPREQTILEVTEAGKKKQRVVTLVDRPLGPALAPSDQERKALPPNYIRTYVLPKLITVLEALHSRGLVHRAIRPSNLFFADSTGKEVVLGECFSTPHAVDQSRAFEPIELILCDPHARGAVDESADMFALGATLMSLYLGKDVGAIADPHQLYRIRISQGSYWALSEGREIAGSMGVALRHLLSDDAEDRWTLSDLAMWAEGAQPPRRNILTHHGLSRPVQFNGNSYNDRRLLADAFSRNVPAAAGFIRQLEFTNWIQTTLGGEIFSDKQERLLGIHSDKDYSSDQRDDHAMIARVCTHLDPEGPIRYRGHVLAFDGLGTALAKAYATGDSAFQTALRELIGTPLWSNLIEISGRRNLAATRMTHIALRLKAKTADKTAGRGLEYALYALNPQLPCISQKFPDQCILTAAHLLEFLEKKVTGQSQYMEYLADRHVLAFAANHHADLDVYLPSLAASEGSKDRQMLRCLDVLAFLQGQSGLAELPNLVSQSLAGIKPMLQGLKGKKNRDYAMELHDKLKGSGSLPQLVKRIDVSALKRADMKGFFTAQEYSKRLARDIKRLTRKVAPTDPESQQLASKMANILGVVFLGVASVTVFMWS